MKYNINRMQTKKRKKRKTVELKILFEYYK